MVYLNLKRNEVFLIAASAFLGVIFLVYVLLPLGYHLWLWWEYGEVIGSLEKQIGAPVYFGNYPRIEVPLRKGEIVQIEGMFRPSRPNPQSEGFIEWGTDLAGYFHGYIGFGTADFKFAEVDTGNLEEGDIVKANAQVIFTRSEKYVGSTPEVKPLKLEEVYDKEEVAKGREVAKGVAPLLESYVPKIFRAHFKGHPDPPFFDPDYDSFWDPLRSKLVVVFRWLAIGERSSFILSTGVFGGVLVDLRTEKVEEIYFFKFESLSSWP